MIETSPVAWLWMLAAMLVSSGASLLLVRSADWNADARKAGVPLGAALALAPLLLGLASVLALGLLPGASHGWHAVFVFALLLPSAGYAAFQEWTFSERGSGHERNAGRWGIFFGALVAGWIAGMLLDTFLMPLTQNDSLEYATVGRLLFEERHLLAYPALSPQTSSSGFFGPWTHPPLYVAMVYFANILQGHAEVPGLVRIIAPWCALATTYLVYTIGLTFSRTAALAAALLFLSTPMYFLGASTALIDPLPVLGLALVLTLVAFLEGPMLRRALLQGVVLGAALWTHSQAILLIPLALVALAVGSGFERPGALVRSAALTLLVAFAIAAWPYLRNIGLYGSPISDNPAVFALEGLGWEEYFRMSRGYEAWPDIVQYGIFKGWFVIEAYGLVFWFMAYGVGLYLWRLHRSKALLPVFRGRTAGLPHRVLAVGLGMLLCYYGGVVVSTLLGVDLMIRNERYLLITLPIAALFAGYAASHLIGLYRGADDDERRPLLVNAAGAARGLFAVLIAVQFVAIVGYKFGARLFQTSQELTISQPSLDQLRAYLRSTGATAFDAHGDEVVLNVDNPARSWARASYLISASGERRMFGFDLKRDWPSLNAVDFIRTRTPPSAIVLSLRPADMFYAHRRMISYLDPRLLPFYRERDLDRAWSLLRDLGVGYLHIPDYSLPSIYNSAVQELIADPRYTRLVASFDGNQVYELADVIGNGGAASGSLDFAPGAIPWTRVERFVLGGRKNLGLLPSSAQIVMAGDVSSLDFRLPIFQRDWSALLISGIGATYDTIAEVGSLGVEGDSEYLLDLTLEGHAYVRIWMSQLDEEGRLISSGGRHSDGVVRFGEIALGPTYPSRTFKRRFVTHPEARSIRIGVDHRGESALQITGARLSRIGAGPPPALDRDR